jgi:hypothetical protein
MSLGMAPGLGLQGGAPCGPFRAGSDALFDEVAIAGRPEAEADPPRSLSKAMRMWRLRFQRKTNSSR